MLALVLRGRPLEGAILQCWSIRVLLAPFASLSPNQAVETQYLSELEMMSRRATFLERQLMFCTLRINPSEQLL